MAPATRTSSYKQITSGFALSFLLLSSVANGISFAGEPPQRANAATKHHAGVQRAVDIPLLIMTGFSAPRTVQLETFSMTGFSAPRVVDIQTINMTGYGIHSELSIASAAVGSYQPAGVNSASQRSGSIPTGIAIQGKCDLAAGTHLSVAGIKTSWNGTAVISSQQVRPAGNGLCSTTINYAVLNIGTAPSKPFTSILTSAPGVSQPASRQWNSLPVNSVQNVSEQVLLRPGQNSITLSIDQTGQLDELSKANNLVRLKVILNGSCQTGVMPQTGRQ